MKPFNISAGFLLTLLAAFGLNAQKLYTWADENGVAHLAAPRGKQDGRC